MRVRARVRVQGQGQGQGEHLYLYLVGEEGARPLLHHLVRTAYLVGGEEGRVHLSRVGVGDGVGVGV